MTFPIRPSPRLAALLVAGSSFACESVLNAPDYRVEEHSAGSALIERYASGPGSCAECLAGGACGAVFASCAGLPACSDFATCVVEHPSPASEAACVVELDPPDEVRATAHALSRCYSDCVGECGGGADFSCAGAYRFPGTLRSSKIRLTQTLRFLLLTATSTAGLDVSVCPPGVACDEPIATVTTDENGTYSAELPISTTPIPEAGFRGFRLVHGEAGRLFPHRLQSSRPLMVDHIEQTGLASEDLTRQVLPRLGVPEEGPWNLIFLQIFDCRIVGAGDIFFEVDSKDARVEYLHGFGQWGEGPTLASQEAAAVAVGLEPGRYHEVRAVTAQGEVVAVDRIYVPGDALVMSTLFPKEAP